MFSKTCEYGIRAMIFVAQKSKEGSRISLKDIAKGTGAPEHFIAKIMQELSRKKMVRSIKGPNGGFYMEPAEMQVCRASRHQWIGVEEAAVARRSAVEGH